MTIGGCSTRRLAWAMAGVFFAYFFHVGVFMPYWPLWLSAQGIAPQAMGTIIALTMVARTLGQPLFSYLADSQGRRGVLLLSAGAGAAALFMLPLMPDIGLITLMALLAAFLMAPLVPVSDMLTLSNKDIHYGRVRLWGSVGFIIANIVAGFGVAHWGTDFILPLAALSLALVVVFAWCVPVQSAPEVRARVDGAARRAALRHALRMPQLWLLMGAAALINGSHGFYYSFVTKYWRETMGLDGTWIGFLWATGVVAEIAVLAGLGGRSSARAGLMLLLLASAGATLRWLWMAQSPPLPMIFILQAFHALSFGAWQLGAVQLMRRLAPPEVATTLMGLQSALAGGVVMAGATWAGGWLYGQWPEAGFYMSAAMAGLGGLLVLGLANIWRRAPREAIPPADRATGDDR